MWPPISNAPFQQRRYARCDDQHAADTMTFDEWLDTEEGRAWLNDEAEQDRFQRHGFHDLESWDYAAMGA